MLWRQTEPSEVADALEEIHSQLSVLKRDLENQADRAPYKFVTDRLRELGAVEENNAVAVAERLAALGRHPPEPPPRRAIEGRNCWERLTHVQEGYRGLIRQLKRQSVRWEQEHPEEAALAASVRDRALVSRHVVADLLARSDPHALD